MIDCPIFGPVTYRPQSEPASPPRIAPLPAGFRRRPARRL